MTWPYAAAARGERVTRAAQELCVTQDAASQQPKALAGDTGIEPSARPAAVGDDRGRSKRC